MGKGGFDVDDEDGVVWVFVEEDLGGFVEVFGSCGVAYGVLVGVGGSGKLWGDVFGDGGGNDPAWDGAAGDGSDAAVGFE